MNPLQISNLFQVVQTQTTDIVSEFSLFYLRSIKSKTGNVWKITPFPYRIEQWWKQLITTRHVYQKQQSTPKETNIWKKSSQPLEDLILQVQTGILLNMMFRKQCSSPSHNLVFSLFSLLMCFLILLTRPEDVSRYVYDLSVSNTATWRGSAKAS